MTRSALTSLLLHTVSHGAQQHSLSPRFYAFGLGKSYGEAYSNTLLESDPILSFLARVRVWLHAMFPAFHKDDVEIYAVRALNQMTGNRRSERRDNHERPLAYRTYALGYILLRGYGFTRFVQWLNTFTLMSRIERCFLPRQRFWKARKCFTACLDGLNSQVYCSALLSPD